MKPRAISTGLMLLLVAACLSLTACPNGNSDGTTDPLRKYAKAADNMAGAINSMIKAKRSLAQSNRLTPAEELRLTEKLLTANTAVSTFNTRVKSLTVAPDAGTKAELVNLLSNVTATINDLNTGGVLGISNPESKQKMTKFIDTINAAIAVFSSLQ